MTFPEAVALTGILTDLGWRRHVAVVQDWQIDRFYRRIARRLDEPSYRQPSGDDPLRAWARQHRDQFANTRGKFWGHERSWALSAPFPEKGQFK